MTEIRPRFAPIAAIISGCVGIAAFIFLIVVLALRLSLPSAPDLMFRIHDGGVVLQSLLMIPVTFALDGLAREQTGRAGRGTLVLGLVALTGIIVLIALIFANVVWDVLYMLPQGLLGVWLIAINWKLSSVLGRALTRFGIVSGIGLMLCGTFPLAYGLLVDAAGLHGPVSDAAIGPDSTANAVTHIVLLIGTFMGVATYPVWAVWLGRRLLRP